MMAQALPVDSVVDLVAYVPSISVKGRTEKPCIGVGRQIL